MIHECWQADCRVGLKRFNRIRIGWDLATSIYGLLNW